MRVVLPGGAGQIGGILAREFHSRDDEVVVLSRTPVKSAWRTLAWDGRTLGDWAAAVDGAALVINLAGRSVNCRYTRENMKQMMDSRVDSTRVIGQAIAMATRPPRLWLQSSTATIYSHRFDAPNDDVTGEIGGSEPDAPAYWKYSIEIAQAWERELDRAETPRTRRIAMRSAMTMSPDPGGVFDTLLGLVRRGLGGRNGDGRQFVSWVHERDVIRAVDWLIKREDLSGPINITSPHPLPNAAFMRELRHAWGTRVGLPAAKWMLEVGAVFLRTDTELILKSRRVVPTRLLQSGFEFEFPEWPVAAAHLCKRWRARREHQPRPIAEDDH